MFIDEEGDYNLELLILIDYIFKVIIMKPYILIRNYSINFINSYIDDSFYIYVIFFYL
jgi:hypothetical protein